MPPFGVPIFTLLHVIVSMIGIVAGLVVVGGLMAGKRYDTWIGIFLWTTLLTNASGFLFPVTRVLPSHIVGAISLVLLPIAIYAFYGKKLEGTWRRAFVITSVVALYFNFFVLMVQLFQKMPALIVLAPNQQGPWFIGTQVLMLVFFVWMGREAYRGFRAA